MKRPERLDATLYLSYRRLLAKPLYGLWNYHYGLACLNELTKMLRKPLRQPRQSSLVNGRVRLRFQTLPKFVQLHRTIRY